MAVDRKPRMRLARSGEIRDMYSNGKINDSAKDMLDHELIPEGNQFSIPDYQSLAEPISPNLDDEENQSLKDPLRMGF